MAIAGKVAITLSTENGGEWSADVSYDRLVAVKHNNNLYISRTANANTEPTANNEVWFLALEGFGGDDVESILQTIENIIDGTTQVGNAKTLDGHGAEYFAPKADLAKYLPLTGGTVSGAKSTLLTLENTSSVGCYQEFRGNNGKNGSLGFMGVDTPVMLTASGAVKDLLHTGNKPTGTYTGNGDATTRYIETGGIGNTLLVRCDTYTSILTAGISFSIKNDGTIQAFDGMSCWYQNGTASINTDNAALNASGVVYTYDVL